MFPEAVKAATIGFNVLIYDGLPFSCLTGFLSIKRESPECRLIQVYGGERYESLSVCEVNSRFKENSNKRFVWTNNSTEVPRQKSL